MRCTDPWVLRSTPNHTPNQQDALPPRLHVVKHFWHLLLSRSAAGDSQGPAALCCLNTPAEPHHSTSSAATSWKRIPLFCSSSNIIRFSSTFSLFSWRGRGSPSRLYCFALFRSQTFVHYSCCHVTFSPIPNHGALPPYWLSPRAQTPPSYATKPLSVQTQTFILPKLFNLLRIWCYLELKPDAFHTQQ